jgi:carboxylate-amine ligase
MEEEFFILDSQTYDLVPGINIIIDSLPRCLFTRKIVYHEFHKSQVEINSGVCFTIDDAKNDLTYLRGVINEVARDNNLRLIGIGTHPTADWKRGIINPQYARNLTRRQRFQAYLTCATHIHFSMSTAKRAVKTINALKYLIPILIPLGANSPFAEGSFTGFKDFRLKIVEKAHTTKKGVFAGIPPSLKDIDQWEKLKKKEDIPMYFDIRPNLTYGTIELRLFDSQPGIKHTLALAGLMRIIVGEIIKKRLGFHFLTLEELKKLREAAIKDGLDGKYTHYTIQEYWTREMLPFIKDAMNDYTVSLKEIKPILRIIESKETLADQQIKIFKKSNNLKSIIKKFCRMFL